MRSKRLVAALTVMALLASLCLSSCTKQAENPPHDIETIRILTIGEASVGALERVSAALSEITLERVGCKVELMLIRADEYDDRIDDLLLENDLADIVVCRDRTAMNKLLDGNYIYRLDRYMGNYPEFYQAVPNEDAWQLVQNYGYTYAIPFGNDEQRSWGFVMRSDICAALNIDANHITTMSQLHRVLERVKRAYPDMIPAVSNYGETESFASNELLNGTAGYLVTEDGVTNISELPAFLERCTQMYQWNQEGLILSDAPFNKESRSEWFASGMAFGMFAQLDRYTMRELEYASGVELECAVLKEPFYGSGDTDMSFGIYAYTENVDLCLQVLKLIYTEPEILSLCVYGQKETDYTVTASGAVVPTTMKDGTERYISWCWPLRDCLAPPAEREDPSWYGTQKEPKQFFFDNSSVASEIYQCGEVLEKYYEPLCSGMIEPAEGIGMMHRELDTANMESVRMEIERQWNKWKETSEN